MRILAVVELLLLCSHVLAQESILPNGCQAIIVQKDAVTIEAKKNTLVFIHNLVTTDLWITHPVVETSASADWPSRIQEGNWSAVFVDKSHFVLNCIESKPGHEQQIPCESTIAVCQWKNAKFPGTAKGTFWVAENMSLAALTAAMGARGFVIPG